MSNNVHVILVENHYSEGDGESPSWEETYTVKAYRNIQAALDFIYEVAKENDTEPDEGGWSVTLPADRNAKDEYGLDQTVYFIENVEIED